MFFAVASGAAQMAKSKRKRVPTTVLKLPDLEQSKSVVLNSLTSTSSKRMTMPFGSSLTGTAPNPGSLSTRP